MDLGIQGLRVLVTAGASGISLEIARAFVREGAHVFICDVDAAALARLATSDPRLASCVCDVADRDQVQAVVDFAVAEFGGLHAMCNNAGLSDNSFGPMLEQDFARFDAIMKVNLLGVMLGTQIAGRHMIKNGGGSIINTSSIGGVHAGFGFTMYRAAKAAVLNFTKLAAIELGPDLVRVNCICPGNILTEMAAYAAPEPGMTQADVQRMQDAVLAVRMSRQPLKRQGSPRDIGQTMLFLASDRSAQMSGQIISVDGAATAGDPRSVIQEMLEARAALGF